MQAPKFITDLFTGPDGVTWAIGRIYSLPMLLSGLAVPFLMVHKGQSIDLTALGVMFGGLGGGIMALVTGTNNTEPPVEPPAATVTTTTTVI
jgi:hypothetical protein